MRVLELTAHVQAISRAEGRSATAAAAYRACDRIICERENQVHDYRRKAGLEAAGIVAPAAAPAWVHDRSRLWNAAEQRERNGARGRNAGAWKMDARTAREVLFGFPAELSPAGRLGLAERIARHLVDAHGVAVDWAIHAPGKLGDQRNHHCHMMFTTRRVMAEGLTDKTREWDGRTTGGRTVAAFRATLAAAMNEALAAEGQGAAVHVEHRSLAARGLARAATKHQGPGRTNAVRQRQARDRAGWERGERQDQAERHGQERGHQARDLAARAAARSQDIDQREARAIEAARTVPPPPEAVRAQPGRLKRLFRAMTGWGDDIREAAAPAQTGPGRTIGDVQATFQAERDRMASDHQRDTQAMADRHQAEDQQLGRAVTARADRDRAIEVRHRRDQADARQRQRTPDRGHDHSHDTGPELKR